MAHPILADQLTLFQPRGTDYAHLITTGTPRFSDLPTALLCMYSLGPQELRSKIRVWKTKTKTYLNLPVTHLLFTLEFWIILIFLTPLTWARGLGIFQLLCHRHCVKLRNHSFRWTNNTPWNPMKSYISFRWKWVLFVYNFPLSSLDGSFAR